MRIAPAAPVRFVALPLLTLAASALMVLAPSRSSAAQEPGVQLRDVPAVKQLQRELVNEGERRILEARERAASRKARASAGRRTARAAHGPRPASTLAGERMRPAPREGVAFDETPVRSRIAPPAVAGPAQMLAFPTNVRINDPSADGATAAQSEVSIAMVGQYGLAAWNDGQGFIAAPNGQGAAYTTDGGTTWTDVGLPPLAGSITDWISDPVVAVNEKTGEFWFCSLTDNAAVMGTAHNGVAIVRATLPGGVFTWDTPHVIRDLPNTSDFIDKEWVVADSSNGRLYLSYTHFIVGGSSIGFQSSANGGLTWTSEQTLSSPESSNLIQGSRPCVAGDGTVYVCWHRIGPIDADTLLVRRSINQGVSFQNAHAVGAYFDNFGTGGPGFNRNRNVVEPCPVVDRSTGPHRGRLFVVVHESLDYFDDFIGFGGNKNEVENNNFFSRATPFSPNQILRGTLTSTTDLDYFSFTATAGQSYIFYCDSIPKPLYTMRIFCGTDTLTRLAYSGDQDAPAGGAGLIVWTAPTSGTFYLRMAFVSATGSLTGNYRVQCGPAFGSEIGRDQRDVVVRFSDDGGTTWSTPKRVNDDAALFDDFMPEVGVTVEGYPYCAWYDYRDASTSCFGQTHLYVSRSVDGGNTWAANQRITTDPTAWTTAPTNIAPNMGDYIGLYAGSKLPLGWGDCRTGEADVNVFGATIVTDYALSCRGDTSVAANTVLNASIGVTNHNALYANTYNYSVSIDRSNWTVNGPSTVGAAANEGTGSIPVSVSVPDTGSGTAHVCVTVSLSGADVRTCCFNVTAESSASVPGPEPVSFGIDFLSPNPASNDLGVSFSLPRTAPARLEILDVNGRRVASLDVGSMGAGRHVARFDREIASLPAGIYEIRLVQNGRVANRKLSLVR